MLLINTPPEDDVSESFSMKIMCPDSEASQPAVYPEGFSPARHGRTEGEVCRRGPGGDGRAAAGGQTVSAGAGHKGDRG